jgi:hypothetical protein
MALDFDAIATALAARYAPGLMSPPSGLGALRLSTATMPQQMSVTPAILVFPDSGTFEYGASTRQGEASFRLNFYYSMGVDMARDSVALRKWVGVLCDQLRGAAQLGGIVASARVSGWKTVKLTYGGDDFNGIELDVTVVTAEPWTATA